MFILLICRTGTVGERKELVQYALMKAMWYIVLWVPGCSYSVGKRMEQQLSSNEIFPLTETVCFIYR